MKNLEVLAKKDRANLVTKKDGTLKARVGEAIAYMVNDTKIYPSYYVGSGRYVRLVSYRDEIVNVLTLLGYKFKEGNDAPRGGAQGDFIKISNTALKTLQSL